MGFDDLGQGRAGGHHEVHDSQRHGRTRQGDGGSVLN